MFEQTPKEEILSIIKEIETDPSATQRTVSKKLGISLGKTNYLLKELIKKDFIKTKHFLTNPNKLKKISYLLTNKGVEEKLQLTHHFLKKKEMEYKLLKEEWKRFSNGKSSSVPQSDIVVKNNRGGQDEVL